MATQHTVETLLQPYLNDILLWEEYVGAGTPFSRDVITVNNATGGTFKQGTVVFRAKGEDHTAVWDIVDADGDIDVGNEYAVVIGTDLKTGDTFTLAAGVSKNIIAITRRAMFKDAAIRAIHIGLGVTTTEFNDMKRLMATQGLLVNNTLTEILA